MPTASSPPVSIPLPSIQQTEQATFHPIPLIFEDIHGSLRRTRLLDLDNRGEFSISPWLGNEDKGIRVRGDIQSSPEGNRVIFVEWGKEIGEGTVYVENPKESELTLDLAEYLPIVNPEQYTPETIETATRRFTSFLDGNQYTWQYHPPENLEMQWECVDSGGETIAYWSLKLPGEPEYYSSGCTLTISQGYEMLSLEMLATCFIIRTFQKRYHDAAVAATRQADGSPVNEAQESDSEEAIARARAAWENRWADCDDSDDSPPSSETDESGNEKEGPPSERSTTSSREDEAS